MCTCSKSLCIDHLGIILLYFPRQVFHCVHFECPADETAMAEYEQQRRSTPKDSAAESSQNAESGGSVARVTNTSQSNTQRLQGLSNMHDEGLADHGDGYGVGFLGGGSGSPMHSSNH